MDAGTRAAGLHGAIGLASRFFFTLAVQALCAACWAQAVLEAPAPGQLSFRAADMDAYADRTFRDRIAHEVENGTIGCGKHCQRISETFARLAGAAGRIMEGEPLSWQLAVASNPREAAWSLAGGRVYISESFVDEYELSDAEIAFVLAHEMSHALLQHENQALSVAAAFLPRAAARRVDAVYEALDVDLGLVFKLQPEFQAEEFEADRAALLLGGAAGFDPDAMLEFLRKAADRSADVTTLIGTHPQSLERLRRALPVRYSAQVLRARSLAARWLPGSRRTSSRQTQ